MNTIQIEVPNQELSAFCQKWQVRELSLFGSVLRDDFRPDSDLDVLVSFVEDARIGLWDLVEMVTELEQLFRRKVDLVEKEGLKNPFRAEAILNRREIVYAA